MIRCDALRKAYDGRPVLDAFSLEVPAGSICALLGPSGCGKTTILRCIAGLERPDAGRIELGGAVVTDVPVPAPRVPFSILHFPFSILRPLFSIMPPERRAVGFVFQDLALWPHMTALDHVAFVLPPAGLSRAARRERGRLLLEAAGLLEGHDRLPGALSGGERQRVALARALAGAPAVLLLDEPFGGLHPRIREDLASRVRRWVRGEDPIPHAVPSPDARAAVLVTHQADEALALADRVAIMGAGRCEQIGTPTEVLARPASASAAFLLGFTSCLPAHRLADNGWVETPIGRIDCPAALPSDRFTLAFRPGDFVARPQGRFAGIVVEKSIRNGTPSVKVRTGEAVLWVVGDPATQPGEELRFDLVRGPAVVG